MRLEAFRVQNYKNIQDTDWIACEDLMVFVGKNESGKTTLFRALSKLNGLVAMSLDSASRCQFAAA